MPLSRVARTHLVYQFIILTLLFVGIGSHELVTEKKYLLTVAFLLVFGYQLMIVAYCTEFINVPRWMSLDDGDEFETHNLSRIVRETSENSNSDQSNPENADSQTKAQFEKRSFKENGNVPHRSYRFRYSNKEVKDCEPTAVQTPTFNFNMCTSRSPYDTSIRRSSSFKETGLTKQYFFPYRQKRLETWIESRDSTRPYKIRNSEPVFQSCQETELVPSSNVEKNDEDAFDQSELTKSYSYPLRRKKPEVMEENISGQSPYWSSILGDMADKSERHVNLKSFYSTQDIDALDNGKLRKSKDKSFSKSTDFLNNVEVIETKSKDKIYISKLKSGLANCFSRSSKKENQKKSKKIRGSSKSILKNILQSRENIHEDMELKDQHNASNFENSYKSYVKSIELGL